MRQKKFLPLQVSFKEQKKTKISRYNNYIILLFVVFLFLIAFIISNFYYYSREQSSLRILKFSNNNNFKRKPQAFPIILIVFYFAFITLSIYIIVELKISSEKTKKYKSDVIKYIYMVNNGYLILSIIYISILESGIIYGILGVSSTFCVGGTIYYIYKLLKNSFKGFIDIYFSFSALISLYILPPNSFWPFIELTDPCCTQITYTQNLYSDGTTFNTKYIIVAWNYLIYFIKRLIFLISTIFYYWFLIFLSCAWLIIKSIILIFIKPHPVDIANQNQNINNNQQINNPNQNNIQNQINPIPINVGTNVNNYKMNISKGYNNNVPEHNTLKMGVIQNSQDNQNSLNSLAELNQNHSRNNYFEKANKIAQERSITEQNNNERVIEINNVIYDDKLSKTNRSIKPNDFNINKDEEEAPPIKIESIHDDYDIDLPNESSIYRPK